MLIGGIVRQPARSHGAVLETAAGLAAVLLVLACQGTTQASLTFDLASLRLDPHVIGLLPGDSVHFQAYPLSQAGDTMEASIGWSATGGTINEDGLYTAGDSLGDFQVIASVEDIGLADTALIAVRLATVASVELDPSALNLTVGTTLLLAARAFDSAGTQLAGRATAWSSSDPTIASVDTVGNVRGEKEGSTTVTADVEGVAAFAFVNVFPPGSQPPPLSPPVFEELWDYDNSAHLKSNPNGWFTADKPPGGGVGIDSRVTLALDAIGPSAVGVGKSLRLGQVSLHYNWWYYWTIGNGTPGSPPYDPNGSYPNPGWVGTTVGKQIDFPGGPIGPEMWVEVWYRLGSGWTTSWPQVPTSPSYGMKMVFFRTQGGNNGRPEVKLGQNTIHWQNGASGIALANASLDGDASVGGTANPLPLGSTTYWPQSFEGQWRFWRVHIKMGGAPGTDFFRFHDGQYLRHGPRALGAKNNGNEELLEGLTLDPGLGFYRLELGINMNVGPWNTNTPTPPGGVSKTTGYLPGNPYPGHDQFYIPPDWQPGQYYWFGPIRVWNQNPGWGW
jgi:hypothetical protein